MKRRSFLSSLLTLPLAGVTPRRRRVETVTGGVSAQDLGTTLMHEHILVDFIGAEQASASRYEQDAVFRAALPKLLDLRARGCRTLVECTPAFLGRDPKLMRRLAEATDLRIVTNTGWYGANGRKHLPKLAWSESAESIAQRWIGEYREGIDGSGIRPGFLKLGVDKGALSEVNRKLIFAGCLCHKSTGLRLHVHSGDGAAAMSILSEMARHDVPASAFVWVHAQNEEDGSLHAEAAKSGAFVEFDGISAKTQERHLQAVMGLVEIGHLDRLLISQDSGWYHVGEPGGGSYNGYTFLFDSFLPALRERGVSGLQIRKLLVENPARALTWDSRG
jgi:phosphotriesterase-related protein